MVILDLGCGSGWLVKALRNQGYNITRIDPNLPNSNSASYLLKRSAYENGFPNGSFDCITCLETIEHLEPRVYKRLKEYVRMDASL